MSLDLPLVAAGVIAVAVLMYVLLDGFDLGIGILFPFAKAERDRDVMMDTVAPVWDGNETWLVLGGGGLFAAFPFAYAVLMPALYLPIVVMLLALILRGCAFEFRHRARARGKAFWTAAFAGSSLVATLAQGAVLGGFIQGVKLNGRAFGGGPFDWATPYSLLVAVGLVAGYALLGAAWLVWRTEGELHGQARRWAWISAAATAALLAVVSLATLFVHPRIGGRWGFHGDGFDMAALAPLLPIPLVGLAGLLVAAWALRNPGRHHATPFIGAWIVFLSGYAGLAVSFFPDIVPYGLSFRDAANADNALALVLTGVALLLPFVLGYTVWVYWLFRGKVGRDAGYH
ncbi:cytochrome d ubiquinol oxidase subunit II [Phenylobacterium sp.]|uniref:cytochrome d ubiquinol oxidase subunit II n=1 Tax=Phenylobacterium sp. TaxID=1871053 RepID=UPI0025D40706|nr:cytochrome d ubiquinol oxidase subunit II [Phenylobacterium sp.]MBX3483880.1 cytochrome d ubiquinol oxidase subunit II [Phenylobacterium sp.]MCW5758334.1 cytochrome d ubiquinol oxidase subunit II [Phenylobacterium sp.]